MKEDLISFCSFLITMVGIPILRRLFLRLGWVHHPRPDRWNYAYRHPIAMGGGIGVFLGVALGLLIPAITASFPFGSRISSLCIPLILLSAGALALGLWDDLKNCRPSTRLFCQGVLALLSIQWVGMIQGLPKLLSFPLTLLGIVGLINSVNLMDNMDGTASGLVALAMLGYVLLGSASNDSLVQFLGLVVGGASLGFWMYNRPPAMIFLGDSGSYFLGFFLVIIGILATYSEYPHWFARWASPLLPAGLFITDTTLVVFSRKSRGREVSLGGRDHLSHRLAHCFKGSAWKANGVLYLIQIGLVLLSVLTFYSPLVISVGLFLVTALGLYGLGRKLWSVLPERSLS